ncbi:MAG TPA: DUF1549 and DUF1553 domain-containing protein [Tepidisphaeraceae bacterium]
MGRTLATRATVLVRAAIVLAWLAAPALSDTAPGSADHWSFKPVAAVNPPSVHGSTWPINPVDSFIVARLESEGLKPAPPADRLTLGRRLYFDLTGLPPSPEELAHFISDPDPQAYEKLVDALLASPRYGERWARHWLDAVRFAESHGFEMNNPRPNAWRYRDYVIRSFNDDLPYNQFVREQLAGDAMGADAATGYLVAGAWDQVKSPDPALTAQQRMDELHDMVSTTGSTFLGLTVGCARCHEHKFDPVSQMDYYRMQAIFAGVQHGERRVHAKEFNDATARLAARRRAVDAKFARFEPKAEPDSIERRRRPVDARQNVERFDALEARFVRMRILATSGSSEPCIDEIEVFAAGADGANIALASAGAKPTASGVLPGFAIHQINHLNDGKYGNDNSWISNQRGKGSVTIELPRKARIDRVVWSRDRDGKFADRVPTKYVLEIAIDDPENWTVVATSNDRFPYRSSGYQPPNFENAPEEERAALTAARNERRSIEDESKRLADAYPMIYAGVFKEPTAPTHRLYRGEAMQPREAVAPGGVAAILPNLDLPADTAEQRRRIAFADWVTDVRNPLPARVIVNRLWQYHFGRGIVQTPSDFGHMGAKPTHPELLDFLASRLIAEGWRLKPIHRLIVLSATYRQSGRFDATAAAADADATLLWRFPPQRIEAEQIRDAILATSGKLDFKMGGPGFDVFKPNENYVRVYTPKEDFGPPEWRRMIYQFKPRLQQDGTFGAFDCPDGGQIAPRRSVSTTPLQALNLLNSPFVLQQAGFFAQRIEREAGNDVEAQVDRAFKLALNREPNSAEKVAATDLIRTRGLPMLCRALLNANEFLYVF